MFSIFLTMFLLIATNEVGGDPLSELSSATCKFSQKLYQEIAVGKSNVVYSPYSIHSGLSMISIGALGNTAKELIDTLGLTLPSCVSVHETYRDLNKRFYETKEVMLYTANAIYTRPKFYIDKAFASELFNIYRATSSSFNLTAKGGPEKEINDFVEKHTNGVIKNLLAPGTINSNTALILINTIFFNGTWVESFSEHSTKKAAFKQLQGKTTEVSFMRSERYVNIKRDVRGVDVAEIPFKGGRFSFYIALPREVEGITKFEKDLTGNMNGEELFEGLEPVKVDLRIPKFKIDFKAELNSALQKIGIVDAFKPGVANFKGISREGQLSISTVIHQAVIEVKETGTVAAASTAVMIVFMSAITPATESFIADHPFVFFLRDKETKQILFQGKFSG